MKSPNLNICADLAKVVARRLDPGDGDPDQLEMNKTPVTPDLIAICLRFSIYEVRREGGRVSRSAENVLTVDLSD